MKKSLLSWSLYSGWRDRQQMRYMSENIYCYIILNIKEKDEAGKRDRKCMCGGGSLLTSKVRNMWSEQGLAIFLNCPAILILEFLSMRNEFPTALPRVVPIYLLPQFN